ncbi:MAG TPA: hypothetical protein VEU08_16595 [Vicinamibacterales bacterium]|nr:hypothetical protein [Vicinamibacterales bacterium]
MPTDYAIDAERGAVFTLGIGTLSILDLLDSMTRLLADSRFSPSFHHIADFRRVDIASPQLSSADIRSLAARKVFDGNSRRAFVIGPSAAFDLARLYATERSAGGEPNIRTFPNVEAAAQWTGVELDAAKQAFAELTKRLE